MATPARNAPGPDMIDRDPSVRPFDAQLAVDGDESKWFASIGAMLESAYLSSDDPYLQSGTTSTAETWRLKRHSIVNAINRDGTFLDLGCANGLLMDSAQSWAAERNVAIEPYGIDLSVRLVQLARSRYPASQERIVVGNVLTWTSPHGHRFDYVRTELDYVPLNRWRDVIDQLLANVVAPSGRLIICSYRSGRRPAPGFDDIPEYLSLWGFQVAGESRGLDHNGIVVTQVAWIDAAKPRANSESELEQ